MQYKNLISAVLSTNISGPSTFHWLAIQLDSDLSPLWHSFPSISPHLHTQHPQLPSPDCNLISSDTIRNLPLQLPTAEPYFLFLLLTDFLPKHFGHSMRHISSHNASCSSQSVWSFLPYAHFHTNKCSGWHSQPLPPVRYTNTFSCSSITSSYTKNLRYCTSTILQYRDSHHLFVFTSSATCQTVIIR